MYTTILFLGGDLKAHELGLRLASEAMEALFKWSMSYVGKV
jgi:hypothetical protein